MTPDVRWYFDFVSPFAYLQWQRIKTLTGCNLDYRPLLFAGLLNHFGHSGPAELSNKRLFSYRHVQWRADRADVVVALDNPGHKQTLRSNFQHALEDDVFGVPSIVIDSQVFWGEDANEMFIHYLEDPALFDNSTMRRLYALPVGAARKRAWSRTRD